MKPDSNSNKMVKITMKIHKWSAANRLALVVGMEMEF